MSLARSYPAATVTLAADELRKYMGIRDVWIYRYDETLAQYYLFLSSTTRNEKLIEQYLDIGQMRAEKAHRDAPEDEEVEETLELTKTKLLDIRKRRAG
jgi:hypothetical protein